MQTMSHSRATPQMNIVNPVQRYPYMSSSLPGVYIPHEPQPVVSSYSNRAGSRAYANGPSGSSGLNGPSGSSGLNGPSGPSGLNGPSGPSGLNALNGSNRPNGSSGLNALNGSNGPNGTNAAYGIENRVPSMFPTRPTRPDRHDSRMGEQVREPRM